MTDTANFISFLQYYLAANSSINALCGGKIVPQDKTLIDDLILAANNATETCITLQRVYRGTRSVPGGYWSQMVAFNLTIAIKIISNQDQAYVETLGDIINNYLVNGIPATAYDGADYYLSTAGEELGRKFLIDPDSLQNIEVLTLKGKGHYRK